MPNKFGWRDKLKRGFVTIYPFQRRDILGKIMKVALPDPDSSRSMSIETALRERKTKREYLPSSITLKNLSILLFAAQGKRGDGEKLTAPSAQEQYPMSVFIVANRVCDIESGIYQYEVANNAIQLLSKGNYGEMLGKTAIGDQPWVANSAATIVLAANIESMKKHFSEQAPLNERGERYVYIETGAIAQNIQLQGTSLGIGMVLVGGFDNNHAKSLLNLQSQLEPTALLCVGNV